MRARKKEAGVNVLVTWAAQCWRAATNCCFGGVLALAAETPNPCWFRGSAKPDDMSRKFMFIARAVDC